MKYLPIFLLFLSAAFGILSNAKAVVYEYELKESHLFSPSIFALIKNYNNTLNTNYRKELLVCIYYKILANLSIIAALVILFT